MQKYPAYKDSTAPWFGDVPESWDMIRLGAILRERGEKNNGTKTENVLSVLKDIGVINYEDKGDIGNKKSEDIERYKIVHEGDLVLNSMNVIIGSVGMSPEYGALSPVYYVLRAADESVYMPYYDYVFKIRPFQDSLKRIGYGILDHRMRIPMTLLKKEPLPKPPLEEQKAIVAYLDEQTAVIHQFLTNKRRLIALLEEQKQVVINTAVTQGLETAVARKPSGIDWLGDIPAHWQMLRNKYVFIEVSDRSDTGEELQLSVHQQLGIIPRSEIGDRPMDESPTTGSKRCQIGDLILNRLKAHLGVFFRTELEGVVSPDYTVFRPKRDVSTKYFEYLFRHPVYIGIWNKTVRGIVAGFYRLYTDDFGNVASVFPPPDEQREIVKFIDEKTAEINAAIERTQREIELIEEYRTTLIAHAVTGKIDVRSVV